MIRNACRKSKQTFIKFGLNSNKDVSQSNFLDENKCKKQTYVLHKVISPSTKTIA